MKAMRVAMDAEMKAAREATWKRHSYQRDLLDVQTENAVDKVRAAIKETFRPQWRELYRGQKKETRKLSAWRQSLERAVFVFRTAAGLGSPAPPCAATDATPIASRKRLARRLGRFTSRNAAHGPAHKCRNKGGDRPALAAA